MRRIILIFPVLVIFIFFLLKGNLKRNFSPSEATNLSIAVINGSGDKLASQVFIKYLQKYNFSVSYVIEINDTFEKTVVIDHMDKDLKNGKIIQKYLGYRKPQKFWFWQLNKLIESKRKRYPSIQLLLDSSLNVSASIILGKDYFEIIRDGVD